MAWYDYLNPIYDVNKLVSSSFQDPNSTQAAKDLSSDKAGYQNVAGTAGNYLGGSFNAPQATAPNMQFAQWMPTNAGIATGGQAAGYQNVNANTMGAANANAASMNAAQLDLSGQAASQGGQQSLIANLQRTVSGQGPSLAQEQLRQSTAANIQQQASAAQAAHGAARLQALRNAAWNNASIQQNANSQAAGLRASEIANAQGQLGNVLGQSRAQDIANISANAQLQQQAALANSGYTQAANLANQQAQNQAGAFNATALNQAALANQAAYGNTSQFNSSQQQALNLANAAAQSQANAATAGAYNTAANNFAQQTNSGNLQTVLANLTQQGATNQLNAQQAQAYITALMQAQGGQTGIDSTLYGGELNYLNQNRQSTGGLLNSIGGALGYSGLGKNIFGGGGGSQGGG